MGQHRDCHALFLLLSKMNLRHGNEAGEKLRLEREAKARVQQAVAACMKVLKLSSMSKDSHVSWSEMEV